MRGWRLAPPQSWPRRRQRMETVDDDGHIVTHCKTVSSYVMIPKIQYTKAYYQSIIYQRNSWYTYHNLWYGRVSSLESRVLQCLWSEGILRCTSKMIVSHLTLSLCPGGRVLLCHLVSLNVCFLWNSEYCRKLPQVKCFLELAHIVSFFPWLFLLDGKFTWFPITVSIFRKLLRVCFSLLATSWVILEAILWVDSELLIHQKVCDPDLDLLPSQCRMPFCSDPPGLHAWCVIVFCSCTSFTMIIPRISAKSNSKKWASVLISLVKLVQRNLYLKKHRTTHVRYQFSWMLVPRFYDSAGCCHLTRIDICHPHHRPCDIFEKVLEGSAS